MSANEAAQDRAGGFESTQWSLVLAAARQGSPRGREALERLCASYWYPLYLYARRRVPRVEDAQDLTQAFFTRLLEKNLVAAADPVRGRFRSFLLAAFQNFLANEREKGRARKRGGGRAPLSLDFAGAEARFPPPASDSLSAEQLFAKQWALSLLELVLDALRDECAAAGKPGQFEVLKEFLAGVPAEGSYAQAAERLGMSENAARVAAHRLRQRYRDLLRAEIARTVAEAADIDDEIRCLFTTLSR